MSEAREMDANLVCAAGVNSNANERCAVERFEDAPVCPGGAASSGAHSHPLAVCRISTDRQIDTAFAHARDSEYYRQVLLLHLTAGELPDESAVGRVVLGYDEQSRRSLVESVNYSGPEHAANAGEIGHVREQGIDEGAGRNARTRVNNQACRFFEDEQVRILEHDVDGDVLSLGLGWSREGNGDRDDLATAESQRSSFGATVEEEVPFRDQALHSRAGELREDSSNPGVEALAPICRAGRQRTRDPAVRRFAARVAHRV